MHLRLNIALESIMFQKRANFYSHEMKKQFGIIGADKSSTIPWLLARSQINLLIYKL